MRYIQRHLRNGEHVIYNVTISRVPIMLRLFGSFFIVSAVAGIVWGITDNALNMLIVYLFGAVLFSLANIPMIIRLIGSEIVLTNKGLRCKDGIISIRNDRYAPYSRIDRIDIDLESIVRRVFDYGNIEFQTIGSDGFFRFSDIAHPYEMKNMFESLQERFSQQSDEQT